MINQIRISVLMFFLMGIIYPSSAQKLDYPELFGDNWKKAENFILENRQWMNAAASKTGVPLEVAEAVVFPELVRYSALRDKIEITLLKALYINLGEEYADFSIGHFQIKPTFAERVRLYAEKIPGRKVKSLFKTDYDKGDIRSLRSLIVSELEDPVKEWNYILAFINICEKRFDLESMNIDTRIIFLATAYNYGFYHTKEEILGMQDKKYFSTKLISTNNYSYSDIALYRYNQLSDKK